MEGRRKRAFAELQVLGQQALTLTLTPPAILPSLLEVSGFTLLVVTIATSE